MLTPKHAWGIVAIVLLISIATFFLWSHREDPEPIIIYKTTPYSPRTAPQETSLSTLDSEVDRGATSTQEGSSASASPKTADALDSIETDDFFDDAFFGEMFDDTQTTASVNEASESESVSPHGFGAYPSVPADFPIDVDWAHYEEDDPVYELMVRVHIKLWNQGHVVRGMSEENGRMYPTIRGRVYVKWDSTGTEIVEVTGHPADMSDHNVRQIEAGEIPAGLAVFDYETEGIDPYNFLDL